MPRLAGKTMVDTVADLFKDILPSILERKKDILDNPKDYNPFMINRALSYHPDCIFEANEMNLLSNLDRKLQYSFYLNSIRPARRQFAKWAKPVHNQDLDSIKTYFGYGDSEAIAALSVLTEEQLATIRTRTKIDE